jgi:hypothetical protein
VVRTARGTVRAAAGCAVEAPDADVGRAWVALPGGEGELVRGLARDLELTGLRAHANGADLAPRDAAAPADEGQQPAGLGLLAAAEVDLEEDGRAREVAA